MVAHWIDENPPGRGNGWEPYPISLRIVNWVKWALSRHAGCAGDWSGICWANHLFANAKALVFASVYFSGPEADTWRDKGLAILRQQLAEQVLADGGHFERSPMYHAVVCEDLLDLVRLARLYPFCAGGRDSDAGLAHGHDPS